MAQQTIAFKVTMTIDLPEGDTEVTQAERDNMVERIANYITEYGITSDSYEGGLASDLVKGGFIPTLIIDEVPV